MLAPSKKENKDNKIIKKYGKRWYIHNLHGGWLKKYSRTYAEESVKKETKNNNMK